MANGVAVEVVAVEVVGSTVSLRGINDQRRCCYECCCECCCGFFAVNLSLWRTVAMVVSRTYTQIKNGNVGELKF